MREIKFRGYHKDEAAYYLEEDTSGWKFGYLIYNKDPREYEGIGYYIKDDNFFWIVEKESIGQYTGLKDKNGVKIFEGDIVEIEYTNGAKEISYVEFEQDFCIFVLKVNSYDYKELTPETDCFEVIGNIYEHPHLLEQTNDNL